MTITSSLRPILAGAILAVATAGAFAQAWPSRPIKIIVGLPAGLAVDVIARVYADKLSKTLGQPVVVENRAGAAGNIAQDFVAKAPADGYTLLYAISNSFVTNPYVYARLPFDVDKDFAPVSMTALAGLYVVVGKDFPANNMRELIQLVRANPGKYSYASYGIGGFPHLMMELILDEEKLNMVHVPYRGGALVEVAGGSIPMVIEPPNTAIPFIRDGRVKGLAYLGTKRHPATPDIPLLSESVPGTKGIIGFHGIWAPAATPRDIVARLNQEIVKASQDPEVQERVRAAFAETTSSTPEELAAQVKRDQARWSALIKAKNIKAE
ncbi:tripartite tricarboxylate transporter substrate binding protein [Ramlibacter sp. XY19]|uniref:Bug family tripartite tricarboxylate transporter substrate binding protein n=1 Tax=Ramlibacter paludis TaxID=2908000 RepID=UPI0023DC09DD|nr:tripartite tricarboxylate transporter substrate binding protein [Ramlibacter paludis]MCG2591442.1 tripartite tricarboxylate transporter substrate binding protein [Ramlibacter paludis]